MMTGKDLAGRDPALLRRLLREMLLIRRVEEKAGQLYGLQKIGGFCHLYIGQEAVAVGAVAALDLQRDYVITGYRDHGHALACGMEPKVMMAELFGKETGCSRGKGGSMHLFDADRHFYGGFGIVGMQVPLGAGIAFAVRYRGQDGVVLNFFGDGAIHQGSIHESMNMARIWNLPVVFICENNQYGMGTDFRRVSSVHDFSVRGPAYDIPARQVNGMDVLEVFDAVAEAVARARTESCPTFLEIRTYRYRGHSMSDPARYRSREELDSYRRQDPIVILRAAMTEAGLLDDPAYEALDAECRAAAQEAADFAETSPEPAPESLYEDILA